MNSLKHLPQPKFTYVIFRFRVDIKSVTWNKDSHGLFDYECKTSNQKKFSVDGSSKLFRIQSSIDLIKIASEVLMKTS
jgi:hypothetical protein